MPAITFKNLILIKISKLASLNKKTSVWLNLNFLLWKALHTFLVASAHPLSYVLGQILCDFSFFEFSNFSQIFLSTFFRMDV